MYIILLLAMFMQSPPAQDLVFEAAQEDFVRTTSQPFRLDQIIPHEDAQLLRMLGCVTYDCRQFAQEQLRRRGWAARRTLIWGTMAKDQEIRSRCDGLITKLVCWKCTGSGLCMECGGIVSSENAMNCNGRWSGRIISKTADGQYVRACLCNICNGTGLPIIIPIIEDVFHEED
jgi:hypothetical protein